MHPKTSENHLVACMSFGKWIVQYLITYLRRMLGICPVFHLAPLFVANLLDRVNDETDEQVELEEQAAGLASASVVAPFARDSFLPSSM